MRVCLFEDRHVETLEPLTLTRPAYDLLCGTSSLLAKQLRWLSDDATLGALVRPVLEETQKHKRPSFAINDMTWLRAETTLLVNARWLPGEPQTIDLTHPCAALVGDEIAYAVVGPELLTYCSPNTLDDCLDVWKNTLPRRPTGGSLFRYLWELVDRNSAQITADYAASKRQICSIPGPGIAIVGPREELIVDPSAHIDPHVVVDTRGGPVVIEGAAVIHAFTRLEGPCYIGAGTHVLGAKIRAGSTLGPNCRVGGEVEASIIQGYSNKYHDGFLGHGYVGEWVNLGAGTHNSDLRNDYGPVTVTVAGKRVETGRTKIGCYLGDHTKSGLGALLNTGTNAGVFCNLLPSGGLLPRHVPSFSTVWNSHRIEPASLANLLGTAGKVMARRGQELTQPDRDLYEHLFETTALSRQRSLRDSEQHRLRRSA